MLVREDTAFAGNEKHPLYFQDMPPNAGNTR